MDIRAASKFYSAEGHKKARLCAPGSHPHLVRTVSRWNNLTARNRVIASAAAIGTAKALASNSSQV
jgi:hypothetical protein